MVAPLAMCRFPSFPGDYILSPSFICDGNGRGPAEQRVDPLVLEEEVRSKPTHLGAFASSSALRWSARLGAASTGCWAWRRPWWSSWRFWGAQAAGVPRPSASAAHICRSHTFRPSTAVFKQGRKGQVAKGGCRQQKQTREHQKGRSWGKCGRAGGIISAGRQQQQQQRASTARG